MKKIGNIAFILASVVIIIISASSGATMHENCNECNRAETPTQPVQFLVETGEIGLGYMLAHW